MEKLNQEFKVRINFLKVYRDFIASEASYMLAAGAKIF